MNQIRYSILKRQRRIKGWDQAKLARMADVHPSTVSKIEAGDRAGPSVHKVAEALGVPMEELITEEEIA